MVQWSNGVNWYGDSKKIRTAGNQSEYVPGHPKVLVALKSFPLLVLSDSRLRASPIELKCSAVVVLYRLVFPQLISSASRAHAFGSGRSWLAPPITPSRGNWFVEIVVVFSAWLK